MCSVEILKEKHEHWKKTQTFKDIIQGHFLIIKYVTLHIEKIWGVPGTIDPDHQQQVIW